MVEIQKGITSKEVVPFFGGQGVFAVGILPIPARYISPGEKYIVSLRLQKHFAALGKTRDLLRRLPVYGSIAARRSLCTTTGFQITVGSAKGAYS